MGHGRWMKVLRFVVTVLVVLWVIWYTTPYAC